MEKIELTKEEKLEVERQLNVIKRGVAEIVPLEELQGKIINSLRNKKPLKVKLGLDPSAPDIHLGHTVVLQKLHQFQELGHIVQLVIGDFTGQIGDPTGKSETRKQLTWDEVKENALTYVTQLTKILDPEKMEISYNSTWLAPLTFSDVVKLAANVTVARMLERDDFAKRYKNGLPISIHEFFYPLMQGYDSVALKSDIEMGGTDQKFNLLMGRTLQKEYGIEPQVTIMMPLLEGLDGVQKMSKSLGNYIGINEAPEQIYGKAMSIPDELMVKYYELVTDISLEELNEIKEGLKNNSLHPRDLKMRLAYTLVKMYHGSEAAEKAEHHFKTVFQAKEIPDDLPMIKILKSDLADGALPLNKLLVLLKLVTSSSEARRTIEQGGVKINQEKVTDPFHHVIVEDGMIIQVGKRKFAKINLE